MPHQNLDGVGARLVAHPRQHQHHRLNWLKLLIRFAHADVFQQVDDGNPVLGWASGENLAIGEGVFTEIGLELGLSPRGMRFVR